MPAQFRQENTEIRAPLRRVYAAALICSQILLVLAQAPVRSGAAAAFAPAVQTWPPEWQADSAFVSLWARTDLPVAAEAAARSWTWGPAPFSVANESYAESRTGRRLVEYLDKGRMEINDPSADRTSPWFVTSGRLVYEMVTGQVQTGNSSYETRQPASLLVAGDHDSPDSPSYAIFGRYSGTATAANTPVLQRLGSDGTLSTLAASDLPGDPAASNLVYFDQASQHNIPAVFQAWMQQKGTVLERGRYSQQALFDPLYVLGHPITEPYWIRVLVAGKPQMVLAQLYERRALTYNPANPPEWQVEMANVGRAYYEWRYSAAVVEPAVSAEVLPSDQGAHVSMRGWNWPAGSSVALDLHLSSEGDPGKTLAQNTSVGTSGRFSALVSLTGTVGSALQSGANVDLTAHTAATSVSLPVAGSAPGSINLEGVLTDVVRQDDGSVRATLRTHDGANRPLVIGSGAQLMFSEGGSTAMPRPSLSVLRTGLAVALDGTRDGTSASVTVAGMTLLSLSATGAYLGYSLDSTGRTLQVTGKGWPAGRDVALSFSYIDTQPVATLHSDSRGNIDAGVKIPADKLAALQPGFLWLVGRVTDKGATLAQVALPLRTGPTPPELIASSSSGDQAGAAGDYCWLGACSTVIGVPLHGAPLQVRRGEWLGLRSPVASDPDSVLVPTSFSGQLFAVPAGSLEEMPSLDGTRYFAPAGQPIYASGDIPGRPLAVSLPANLAAGNYALVVTARWPAPAVTGDSTTQVFYLTVP